MPDKIRQDKNKTPVNWYGENTNQRGTGMVRTPTRVITKPS